MEDIKLESPLEIAAEPVQEETAPKSKVWPDSANKWESGKKVIVQDIYGHAIKSCLVVNHSPNYLVVLKVGGAFSKLRHGFPVKVNDNVFYIAERNEKKKLVALFFVCEYSKAQEQLKAAEVAKTDTLIKDCSEIIDGK